MPTLHPAKGIKDILDNAGVLGAPWTTQLGRLADKDNSISITDNGGRTPDPGLALDYPSVQIVIQGNAATGYLDGRTKAQAIKDALLGIPGGPAQFPELTQCNMMGDINFLGYTDANRPRFSMNFALITEPVSAGYRESL